MVDIRNLAHHLAPDTVRQWEQSSERRFREGECLMKNKHLLGAIYLYGYSVEMCLAAAYFRSVGFRPDQVVDDDIRCFRMKQARQEKHLDGKPLMSSDPHPLVGWARLLEWHRLRLGNVPTPERNRLREAVRKAEQVYKHWRPELRYKSTNVSIDQFNEVRLCVHWFIKQHGRL